MKFGIKNLQNDIDVHSSKSTIKSKNNEIKKENKGTVDEKGIINKKSLNSKILISMLVIGLIIGIIFIFTKSYYNYKIKDEKSLYNSISENDPLELEFKINTEVNDLRRVSLNRKNIENIKIDGIENQISIYRKSTYDIYIISEEDASAENKNFYNKTFNASVLLVSECINTENDTCVQKKIIDFTNQNYTKLKNLNEIDDLKEVPIPLCLFNVTDNGVILSMECPESLSQNKKNDIISDLYHIKPVSIKRINKEEANITITKEEKDNKHFIRESHGGVCDIENSMFSFCSKDKNTTLDNNGYLLSYNETSFTNITSSEKNSYISNQIIELIDETNNTNNLSHDNYNKTLNKILPKLIPYMKKKKYTTNEDFEKLYNDSKKEKINTKNLNRKLSPEKTTIINEQQFFSYKFYSGIEFGLYLDNNLGYNSENMHASLNLKINDEMYKLSGLNAFSNINEVLGKILSLSKAGNKLATILYNNIKDNLNNIIDVIQVNITKLNNLILFKDLVEIFDSTLSLDSIKILPYNILEESNSLNKKLEGVLNGIENDEKINKFGNEIYDYRINYHKLIDKIVNNLKELGDSLNSPKNKLTSIGTYYLNSTTNSFINNTKNIIENYEKNEKDSIIPKINLMINDFEENFMSSINKEINLVNNLYNKIKNKQYSINNTNNEDYKKILSNLDNSNYYINKILSEIENKIEKKINLNNNGYFISDNDLQAKKESYSKIINDVIDIANKLDNNEFIDKTFDEIMSYVRNNYTSIIRYMNQLKNENFKLEEKVLKDNFFTELEQTKLAMNVHQASINILNNLRNENKIYFKEVNTKTEDFIVENKEYLNQIISEIDILFSEKNIKNLVNLYENGVQSCFEKIKNEIKHNKLLLNDYFKDINGIFDNNTKIIEILNFYQNDEKHIPSILIKNGINYSLMNFEDKIKSKIKTQGYLNKYKIFLENIDYFKDYINEQLNIDLLYEYKNMIIKIKELFQSIKNNNIFNKYDYLIESNYIDNNINYLNRIYNRFNKYISDSIFNNKYYDKINKYKVEETSEINSIANLIESYQDKINTFDTYNDYNNDFCINFLRLKTYEKSGNLIYMSYTDYYCLPLSTSSDNYKKLSKINIYDDDNIKKFIDEFNKLYVLIEKNINSYNIKLNNLTNIISLVEKDFLSKSYNLDYLSSIQKLINKTLSEKYGEKLLKSCYNYFQNDTEKKVEYMLNSFSNKWYNYFNSLIIDINKNINNFKYSTKEFGIINSIYINTISQNITKDFVNSIIIHQKSEFNYTISFYYNFLLKTVNSTQQYILSKFPVCNNGFNYINEQRKKEISDIFTKIIKQIIESKNESLKYENQINILENSASNFFKINSILSNNIIKTKNNLNNKISQINLINNNKVNDLFSFSSKYYLEDLLSGYQISSLYETNNYDFINLNKQNYLKLLYDNWIFDQDDIISQINLSLYNSNLEIKKEFLIIKEECEKLLENKINNYFNKENIVEYINIFYKNGINNINSTIINKIMENIEDILNNLKDNLLEEVTRLKTTATSYNNNYTKINKTIEEYKTTLFIKINSTIFSVLDNFYQNILNKLYTNIIEKHLNEYLSITKDIPFHFEEYNLLNSTYNIRKIIENIVENLVVENKNITRNQIEYKYYEYYQKIKNDININLIQKLINEEIDKVYIFNLLPTLQKSAVYQGKKEYDLSNKIKKNIDLLIDSKITELSYLVETMKGNNNQYEIIYKMIDSTFVRLSITNIENKFHFFMISQIQNEKKNFVNILQKIIKSNFNKLLNNIIPSFGNDFFERLIKYNENFKIANFYNNIKLSLSQTLSYYINLYIERNNVNSLPEDLKIKLYNLNNIDSLVKDKNDEIFNLLDIKIDEFINDSIHHIINKYTNCIKSDVSIQLSFNNIIHQIIITNLDYCLIEMKKNYITLLNKYFKEQFIKSYISSINYHTDNMIKNINEQRELLKFQIDDLFTIDSKEVFNQINNKTNLILKTINEYNNYCKNFKLSEDFTKYLNNFGENYIKPQFNDLKTLLNKITKNYIFLNIEQKSQIYENSLNLEEYLNLSNTIKNNCFKNIRENINLYGPDKYPDNLQKEINRLYARNRRLEEENNETIFDRSIIDIFSRLLNISKYNNIYINSLNLFDKTENIIFKNIQKLNIAFKVSQKIIYNNNYEEEITNTLINKLIYLKNITSNYYKQINQSFYELKNYIKDSINEIDISLNKCANITYDYFQNEYKKIINEVEILDKEIDTVNKDINKTTIIETENQIYYIKTFIESINEKAKFKFNVGYENNDFTSIYLNVNLINQINPIKMIIDISSPFGECGKIGEIVEVYFNNISYTTNLNFNTNSTNINIRTIFEADRYKYSIKRYKIEDNNEILCSIIMGLEICLSARCNSNAILIDKTELIVQNQYYLNNYFIDPL